MIPLLVLLIVIGLPVMGVLSIPLLAIWTHHKRHMEELSQKRQRIMNDDVRAEFTALRQEIKALHDTAMQYDLSFDTTMQHLDRRVGQLEHQMVVTKETKESNLRTSTDTGITQNLYNGRS